MKTSTTHSNVDQGDNDKQRRSSLLGNDDGDAAAPKGCPSRAAGWCRRNVFHVALLLAAVLAVVTTIILSLDACETSQRNVTHTSMVTVNEIVNKVVNVTKTVTVNKTVETVTPLAAVVLIDGSTSMSWSGGAPWTQAKSAIPVLNTELDGAMNAGNHTGKLRMGLVQWSNNLVTESALSQGVAASNAAAAKMSLMGGTTFWGPALCRCYKLLVEDPEAAASDKMCVLLADGDNSQALGSGQCASPDVAARGAAGSCACDRLWSDAAAAGFTSAHAQTTSKYVEEFVKARKVQVMAILVGAASAGEDMWAASSCEGAFDGNDIATMNKCDHFLFLQEFKELEAAATTIAARAKALATVSETKQETTSTTVPEVRPVEVAVEVANTETSVESFGVCSLDFLWALLAFLPLLLYILYRIVAIRLASKTIREALYEKIAAGELTRQNLDQLARVATELLLPKQRSGDIDFAISWTMFRCCPCLLPANEHELAASLDKQCTIPL